MSRIVIFLFLTILPSVHAEDRAALRLFMQGDFLFQKHCSACHGKSGRGDGQMGRDVEPQPRDFREGVFKFRSTPMGFLPTDEDLLRTIRRGIAGTAMPSFPAFRDAEKTALLAYIKGFSQRWKDPALAGKPVGIPPPPVWMKDEEQAQPHVMSGKAVYTVHCATCHGAEGRGDSPAAEGLKDAWDKPISPANLAIPGLRSGPEPEDVFRTVATGMDGTPMVGHLDTLGPEKIWDLVAFIRSLAGSLKE